MAFPPNTSGRAAQAVAARSNWFLALLTTALICVGALTVAVGLVVK
jgi:hypothetical protein